MQIPFLLPALLAPLTGYAAVPEGTRPVMEDIYTGQAGESIVFGNRVLTLQFDGATGELAQVSYVPKGSILLDNRQRRPNADLHVDGRWLSATEGPKRNEAGNLSPWRYEEHEVERVSGGAIIHLTSSLGPWKLRTSYRLWPRKAAFERWAAFIPSTGASGRVSGARLTLHGLGLGDPDKTSYAHLSNYPPEKRRFSKLSAGRRVDEFMGSNSGHFVLIHDEHNRLCVPITYFSRQESSRAYVIEGEQSISVTGHQNVLCDVKPDQEIGFGSQLLAVAEGNWRDGLAACQELYDLIGLRPPKRTRKLAARTVMYSAHVGGTIDSGFRDVGGFRDFARLLPHLRDLGVNVLWLLPVWHGPVYAPDDYYALDPRLGTEEDLKALVDQAHSLGIRVLLDLIPHGPLDTSGFHEQHPDLISRNEDGSLLYWWGCLSCDYANPGWQKYMAEHAAYWVKQVGADGYRVDCAAGGPPNWRPYNGNRPSMSGLYGGLGVLAAARAELEKVKPDILLLPEAAGPPFFESGDYAYNWAFYFGVLSRLPSEGAETWVPRAAEWLENQRYTFPRGAKQLMFLENHDLPRAILRFGVGCQRALLALCAYVDATPFLYHDQEIGYGPYLRKLYSIRAEHDELTLGDASYTALRTDPAVFTIVRSYKGRVAVVAINFRGRRNVCRLDLSECPGLDASTRYGLWDCFCERRLDREGSDGLLPHEMKGVEVPLEPWSPAVILIRPPKQLPRQAEGLPAPRPTGKRPQVVRDGKQVVVDNGIYRLQVGPTCGGMIERLEVRGSDQRLVLAPTDFGTWGRRLWLGGDMRLGPETLREIQLIERPEATEVIARGTVARQIGDRSEPALDYEVRHIVRQSPEIGVRLRLIPRVNVSGVLGSLATVFAFPEAQYWAANTIEGLLYDEFVPRRSADRPYHTMYAYPHSDRLFASHTIPLDPDTGFIGAQWSEGAALLVEDIRGWSSTIPQYVMLKERLGDRRGLHGLIVWADGSRPLTLRRGETYDLTYTLRIVHGGEAAIHAAALPRPNGGAVNLRTEGSRYVIETKAYRAVVGRGQGGALEELALPDVPTRAIAGSTVYTDYGIYGEWTDPLGKKHKINANSSNDLDPDVTIIRHTDELILTFSGRLRHPQGFGRRVMHPVTQQRVTYRFTAKPTISVECAVRPHVTRREVRAFLAQILRLPGAAAWAVYAGKRLVASDGGPAPQRGERVWESAVEEITQEAQARIVVELPGAVCAEFSGFAGLQEVQNLFLLRDSSGCTLFLAFLDGRPTALQPAWRTVRYQISLHRGLLAQVADRLGLPASKGGHGR